MNKNIVVMKKKAYNKHASIPIVAQIYLDNFKTFYTEIPIIHKQACHIHT